MFPRRAYQRLGGLSLEAGPSVTRRVYWTRGGRISLEAGLVVPRRVYQS
jgi:hypothetical protein